MVFASRMTTVETDKKGRTAAIVEGGKAVKKLFEFFSKMTALEFMDSWFTQHDLVANYSSSGLQPKRIVSVVAYLEPINQNIEKILDF